MEPNKLICYNMHATTTLKWMIYNKMNQSYGLSYHVTEIINKSTYKSIKPVGSRSGILYGSSKIHQQTCNGLPPFRPILSAIDTHTYKLAKF